MAQSKITTLEEALLRRDDRPPTKRLNSFGKLLAETQEALNQESVWQAVERLAVALMHAKVLRGEQTVAIIKDLLPPPPGS